MSIASAFLAVTWVAVCLIAAANWALDGLARSEEDHENT
jgi:hypothetical protein